MSRVVDRLAIAGVGLIGGSLALAARAAGVVGEIVGLGRTEANLEVARARGIVDRVTRDPAVAAAADVIVLAVPVGAGGALARTLAAHARPGTLLTDVGSVKHGVLRDLEDAWRGVGPVVGGHPIAGSDEAGAGAARADLFRGRRCILTPTATTEVAALERVRTLWEGVGARVETMAPDAHDALLARVSHAPHLVAYALVAGVPPAALPYAGSGFRDTTRIAGSPAEVWRDIALANAPAVRAALVEFRAALAALEALIAAGDATGLERALAAARAARRTLGDA